VGWEKGRPRKHSMAGTMHAANDELDHLRDLLAWVGKYIKVRAASMATMTKGCRLCVGTKLRKEMCRHNEVWAVTASVVDADAQGEMAAVERLIGEEAAD
jgi:hypothetical protein